MIMGLFGGTVFPIAMGLASDAVGQSGAVAVMDGRGSVLVLLYAAYEAVIFVRRLRTHIPRLRISVPRLRMSIPSLGIDIRKP